MQAGSLWNPGERHEKKKKKNSRLAGLWLPVARGIGLADAGPTSRGGDKTWPLCGENEAEEAVTGI